MKVVATVAARMGSSRLPGKVLFPILGKPMLARQIERIRQSRLIDEVVIATSVEPANDVLETLAQAEGVSCFRGSEDDVLGRITGALRASDADLHVEFMGDNPMPDASLVDGLIGLFLKHRDRCDYLTNALTTTYPPGAEVYVYPAAVLLDAERYAGDGAPREHVGIHIYQHPERYRILSVEAPPWLRSPHVHLEVDTAEDFEVVREVFETLYPSNPAFSLRDALDVVERRGLQEKNQGVERRWRAFRQEMA